MANVAPSVMDKPCHAVSDSRELIGDTWYPERLCQKAIQLQVATLGSAIPKWNPLSYCQAWKSTNVKRCVCLGSIRLSPSLLRI